MENELGAIRSARAPLRWAGSKSKLLPIVRQLWPNFEGKYIEAFAGSAAFFFNLAPRKSVLNDSNADLIHSYQILRDSPKALFFALNQLDVSPTTYYRFRSELPMISDPFERAIRFFYLNRYSFNGIYRTNTRGEFNVPFGGGRTGGFPPLSEWLKAAHLLTSARLTSLDFQEAVTQHVKQGDFVYMDPPYAVTNRRIFSQYSAQTFGLGDIERLRNVMHFVHECGSKFLVSYAHSPEGQVLAKGWRSIAIHVQRNIAGFAKHRRLDKELLITNY